MRLIVGQFCSRNQDAKSTVYFRASPKGYRGESRGFPNGTGKLTALPEDMGSICVQYLHP